MKIEADSPIQHLTILEILKVGDIQTDKPLQNKTARILFLRQTQVWLFNIYSHIYSRVSLLLSFKLSSNFLKTALQMLQLPKSFRILSDKESHLLEHIKNYERRVLSIFELPIFEFFMLI